MATAGLTSKPSTRQEAFFLNNDNQHATLVTLPSGGPWRITRVGFFAAGMGSAVTAYGVVWSSGGSVLAKTAAQTIPAGSSTITLGLGYEVEAALASSYEVNGGTSVYVGFSRNPAEGVQFPSDDTGSHYDATKTGTYPGTLSGGTHSGYGRLGAYITYEAANHLPTAPTLISPASGARITTQQPEFKFDHNDSDNDNIEVYDLQVDNNSGFGTPWWEVDHATSGIDNTLDRVERTVPLGNALPRGVPLYWRARTADHETYGPWSGGRTLSVNALPTHTIQSPVPGGACNIWNLDELAVWTPGGAHAKPILDWNFTDDDGDAQSAYIVRIYDVASGGSPIYNSGTVYTTDERCDADFGLVNGQQYWWSVNVRDALGEWEYDSEPPRTPFFVRWGQAIYEYNPGAGSSAWQFSAAAITSGAAAFLFASATGAAGAGRSAWKTSIGAVTPGAWLNVLVRLRPISTAVASVSPALPDMQFTYLGVGAALSPDKWSMQSTNPTDWAMDPDFRRFGSQALRCQVTATAGLRYIYPYEGAVGSDVAVTPNTEYVFSAFINSGALPINADVRLAVMSEGSVTAELSPLYVDDSNALGRNTNGVDPDTGQPLFPEGWQRLTLRFRTAEQTRVRPMIRYGDSGTATVGDTFWADGVQMEEAVIASGWRPGMVGNAAVLDASGLVIDGLSGGIFRLRGSAGALRDVVALGPHGLLLGGDSELASPSTGVLTVNGVVVGSGGGGGVTDHGALTGLADDDHPQYMTDAAHTEAVHTAMSGLATQSELDTHAAAANPHAVYATDADLTTHAATPHAPALDFGEVADIVAETFGATAAAGATGEVADAGHRHAMPADPVTAHVAAGDPHPAYATDTDLSTHAAAADPHATYAKDTDLTTHAATSHGVTAHSGLSGLTAGDDHTQYQKESEKGAASGYASLDAGTKVPTAQLGGAGADNTKFLRGDQTWTAPTAAHADLATHDALGLATDAELAAHAAAADPHTGYATDTDLSTHAAAADPHTGYQRENEKGVSNGYAPLDSQLKVPATNIAFGTPDGTKYLGDNRTWSVPPYPAHPDLATHDALGLATDAELATHAAAADPHPTYETSTEAAAKITAHEAATNPHSTYETSAEAASKISAHEALPDPHTDYVKESSIQWGGLTQGSDTSLHLHNTYATDTDLTTHAATPHGGTILAPCIRVERATSTQSIPNGTETDVIFNTIVDEDDELGDFSMNTSTGVLTINRAGWYSIDCGIVFSAGTSPAGKRQLNLQMDATTIASQRIPTTLTGSPVLGVSTLIKVAAGAQIKCTALQDTSASQALTISTSRASFLSAARVR